MKDIRKPNPAGRPTAHSGSGSQERGTVLVMTLLLMLLMSALVAGFSMAVYGDHQFRRVDRDRTEAFYAAHAGLEKLTADLGAVMAVDFAPKTAQIQSILSDIPQLPGVAFLTPDGQVGYQINYPLDPNGNPLATVHSISDGPYQGLTGMITPYTIDVTARTARSSEVRLTRRLQTVAIPVFQFGLFSETDLSFFAGPDFNFGGRVHTNGNLFLAAGSTLTMSDKVTAVGEVVRKELSNGWPTLVGYLGNVRIAKAPGLYRDLLVTEGSVLDGLLSPLNEPLWTNISISAYNGNLRNGRTGAKRLDLPLITVGGSNVDLIRRPAAPDEDATNSTLFDSRYFSMASLRILLSDAPGDILSLPTVTQTPPVRLGNLTLNPIPGYAVDGTHPPLAVAGGGGGGPSTTTTRSTDPGDSRVYVVDTSAFSIPGDIVVDGTTVQCTGTGVSGTWGPRFEGCTGTQSSSSGSNVTAEEDVDYRTPPGTPLLDGYLKIEKQDVNGTWSDVTLEILNLGVAGRNLAVGGCNEPNPNAIVRFQRLRDDPSTAPANACGAGSTVATDYWPNTLYDTREGNRRDDQPGGSTNVFLGGVMHYVELDVNNLRRWFQGTIGFTGSNAMDVTGYTVYFSDRRGNHDAFGDETAEYGAEDFVNPASATGAPNATLDLGEDVNGNGVLDTYGQTPMVVPGAMAPLDAAARPWTSVPADVARVNRPLFFRRALKVVNGRLGNIIAPGLTIAAENPVYLEGNYNADNNGFGDPHVATSIIADALSPLSNSWSDRDSFNNPHNPGARNASTTWYRTAIIAGNPRSFPRPLAGSPPQDFGTDGGVHNFLRFLESWSGDTLNYRGSIAVFFHSRQATGTYKCCSNVYSPPTRAFAFDADFLNPTLLPPRTPAFRDINTLGFTQVTTVPE